MLAIVEQGVKELVETDTKDAAVYRRPEVTDHGTLADLTAGCVGGVPDDAMAGADTEAFPADSGLFCGP
jgi:hypothetical protein